MKNADSPNESEKPVGHDGGFLWRMNSYWAYVERDGGVYVECESVSLTRDIPTGLGWLIRPLVTGIPRESLQHTLEATRNGAAARARVAPEGSKALNWAAKQVPRRAAEKVPDISSRGVTWAFGPPMDMKVPPHLSC